MDEEQVILMIQNVVSDALKEQSTILEKKFKEFEHKLAKAYGISVNEKLRLSSFELEKSPIYDFITKDNLIKPVLSCPPLSEFRSDCLRQPTNVLNQTKDSVSYHCSCDKLTSSQLISNYHTHRAKSILYIMTLFVPTNYYTKSFTFNEIIYFVRCLIENFHSFWKIYPPPKIIKNIFQINNFLHHYHCKLAMYKMKP